MLGTEDRPVSNSSWDNMKEEPQVDTELRMVSPDSEAFIIFLKSSVMALLSRAFPFPEIMDS